MWEVVQAAHTPSTQANRSPARAGGVRIISHMSLPIAHTMGNVIILNNDPMFNGQPHCIGSRSLISYSL